MRRGEFRYLWEKYECWCDGGARGELDSIRLKKYYRGFKGMCWGINHGVVKKVWKGVRGEVIVAVLEKCFGFGGGFPSVKGDWNIRRHPRKI
jgi:hypothetical protein